MRILIVAADRREFAGWNLPVAGRSRSFPTGRLNGHEVLLVANGAGRARAAAAVDEALSVFPADAVVSAGFCGALDPALRVADIVVGTTVSGPEGSYAELPVRAAVASHSGPVCSLDHVARTAEEKRMLRAAGACAVEMEAAGVAARAHSRGLPFYCVHTVTDLASETLQNDFNRALRTDGHFDTMIILRDLLQNPRARLAELVRLRKRCVRASRALGNFLGHCRF
ncbi:MAG: hypothetical protein LAQ30_08525 [Acidobacteriia bacterium]|nr:hypothetical protein [Terriglobia bacterium]